MTTEVSSERREPRWTWLVWLAVTVAAAAAAAIFLASRCSASGPVLFGDVTVTGSGAAGRTTVVVAPAGTVSASTHDGPLGVTVRLDTIDVDRIDRDVLADRDAVTAVITSDVTDVARAWLVRSTILSTLLGAGIGLAVSAFRRQRSWRGLVALAAVGALSGAAAMGAAGATIGATFDSAGFANPSYEGALRYAPDVLEAAGDVQDGLDSAGAAVAVITSRVEAFTGDGSPGVADRDDVVILHVSDLHMNPLGAEFVSKLADEFDPDAVIDTGDFTSVGLTDLESLYANLVDIEAPYYLVPGNHDAASTVDAIRAAGVVTVVDGDVVDIEGLRFGGLADPTFTPAGSDEDDEAREAAYESQRAVIGEFVDDGDLDVIGLHNPAQSAALSGSDRPITVLSGHIHKPWFERAGEVSVAVAGTSGADGLTSFVSDGPGVYGAQVLRFRRVDGHFRLWSVDRIDVDSDALLETGPGRFRIERIALDDSASQRYLPEREDAAAATTTTAP